jgi:hypothetical protein
MELFTPALHVVHSLVSLVVLVASVAAIFVRGARRAVQYLIGIQILIGVAMWSTLKIAPPPAHWLLAVAAAGGFGVAAAFERRGRPKSAVMGLSAVSAVLVVLVMFLGMQAARG